VKLELAIKQAADEKLNELASFIFTRSQEALAKNGSADTGGLLGSGELIKTKNGYLISYSAPYAMYVEFGTHPHMPPVEPLQRWARRKLGLSTEEAQSVGWAIAMNIKKNGTEPQPFLRPAIQEARAKYGIKTNVEFTGSLSLTKSMAAVKSIRSTSLKFTSPKKRSRVRSKLLRKS
jgi:hypothetical protein